MSPDPLATLLHERSIGCVRNGSLSAPRWCVASHDAQAARLRDAGVEMGLDGPVTRLYVSADAIEAALKRLRGPVTGDEATVMAAAQAAADALRGSRIEYAAARENKP